MGIFITHPPSQLLCPFIMGVLQMHRNRKIPCFFHYFCSLSDRFHSRVAFRRASHICGRLGQNDLCLRHSYPFRCQGRADRHLQSCRIRISHILRCTDHNPPCNKSNAFTRIQHTGQIVNSRIRIRSPHAFYKCRYGIIMVITRFIIAHHPFLNTFLCYFHRNMYLAVFAPLRRHNAKFHRIQGMSRIPS